MPNALRRLLKPSFLTTEEQRRRNRTILWVVYAAVMVWFGIIIALDTFNHTVTERPVVPPVKLRDTAMSSEAVMSIPTLPQARNRLVASRNGAVREVTAFNSLVSQTDGTPCIGASGVNICERWQDGEQVCAANFVPFGTELIIQGVTTCTVLDRLSARYPQRVDLYMGYDVAGAIEFGIKKLNVTIKRL